MESILSISTDPSRFYHLDTKWLLNRIITISNQKKRLSLSFLLF